MLGSALSRRALAAALFASLAFSSSAVAGDDTPAPAAPEGQGVQFLPGSPTLDQVLAKAAEQKKPAFLDFMTDT